MLGIKPCLRGEERHEKKGNRKERCLVQQYATIDVGKITYTFVNLIWRGWGDRVRIHNHFLSIGKTQKSKPKKRKEKDI